MTYLRKIRVRRPALMILIAMMGGLTGCDEDENARVAKVATQAAERQAKQNEEMARLNREVAEGTKRLIEDGAAARRELTAIQRELQAERVEIGRHRDVLEEERKEMARQRRTVSLLAPIITGCAVLLAVTVLGVFCWSLLFGLRREDSSHEVLSELLVDELNLLHPTLLSGPEHGPNHRSALQSHHQGCSLPLDPLDS